MTEESKRLAILNWMHNPDRRAAWKAVHEAIGVSEREPTDDELPLLRAATTRKEAA